MTTQEKKVIAIIAELDPSMYELYFNDMIENFCNDLIIDGGKNCKSYNDELMQKIKNIKNDFEAYSFEGFKNEKEYFDYNLPKENKTSWNDTEIDAFKNNFSFCGILKIITNKNYNKTILKGYSQGDMIQVFYNSDIVKNDDLKMLECLYFGGCYEIIYSTETTDPEKIYDFDFESFIVCNNDYNKNNIINEIKNNTNIENITLYERKEIQVIKYYYEEI